MNLKIEHRVIRPGYTILTVPKGSNLIDCVSDKDGIGYAVIECDPLQRETEKLMLFTVLPNTINKFGDDYFYLGTVQIPGFAHVYYQYTSERVDKSIPIEGED